MGCCKMDENDENNDENRWCIRMVITILAILVIVSVVSATAYYRKTKRSSEIPKDVNKEEAIIPFRKMVENMTIKSNPYEKSDWAVFADYPFCADTGNKILTEGGSAVDAGIAMLFCQGVVEPQHSGLGGGFIMTIYDRSKRKVRILDARGTAPQLASASMFEGFSVALEKQLDHGTVEFKSRQEWLTITIPGEARGLWEAHKKYGKLEWHILVEPAIRLASRGFPVSSDLAKHLRIYNETIRRSPQLRKVFINPSTNEVYNAGEGVTNEDLAQVLTRIANEGVDFIYKGEGALKVAAESLNNGGLLSSRDFNTYEVRWRDALSHTFMNHEDKSFTLYMPPPPSCAIMIGMILNIVKGYEKGNHQEDSYSSRHLAKFNHRAIEAMKHAFSRKYLFGDSTNVSYKVLYTLLNSQWGFKIQNSINLTDIFPPEYYTKFIKVSKSEDRGTANVAAIDFNGDVMVASSSLHDPFGCGIVSEALGFLLNDNMLAFTMTEDGNPIGYDFANIVSPAKRPLSFLSPIIVLDDENNFKLAMSASGGARIPTSMALVLMRYFWLNDDIKKANEKLRFHHQLEPNVVFYEGENKLYVFEYLLSYGHKIEYTNSGWPHVNHIVRENGILISIVDSRGNM